MSEKAKRQKQYQDKLNKLFGKKVAYNLGEEESPATVKFWIPTGSRLLDSITLKGKMGGIPSGKVVQIEGLPTSGKSYMASQIMCNALKMDIACFYFDSESAIDFSFLQKIGVSLSDFTYVQNPNLEDFFVMISSLMSDEEFDGIPKLFILDSLAMTPTTKDLKADFDPGSDVALRPRIMSKAFKKLIHVLANTNSTLLILNQLYHNIKVANPWMDPYESPGGQALKHAVSLNIRLTGREGQSTKIKSSNGTVIGSSVKAKIEKSRFGTQDRSCNFKILWGTENVSIQDEESWLDEVKKTKCVIPGAWHKIIYKDGTEEKFRAADWEKKLQTEPKFRERVIEILDNFLLHDIDDDIIKKEDSDVKEKDIKDNIKEQS